VFPRRRQRQRKGKKGGDTSPSFQVSWTHTRRRVVAPRGHDVAPGSFCAPRHSTEGLKDLEKGLKHDFERGFKHDFQKGLKHDFERGLKHDFQKGLKHDFQKGLKHDFEKGFKHDFEKGLKHDSPKEG